MPSATNRHRLNRFVYFVVDQSPLWSWIVAFVTIVAVFGILYAVLTPVGHGMVDGAAANQETSLWRGIYFSVVTVSSLGYGDIHPKGAAKVLVGIEVLFGLAFMGVMIAKLTSKPLTHLVSRLFVSETKRQLDDLRRQFDMRASDFRSLLELINQVYQPTPSQAPGQPTVGTSGQHVGHPPSAPANTHLVEESFSRVLNQLFESSGQLYDYMQEEGLHRNYFVLAPTRSLLQLADAIQNALFLLGQSIASLPTPSTSTVRADILTHANRIVIDSVIRTQEGTCEMMASGVRLDERVQHAFAKISGLCDNIASGLLPIQAQPDQLIQAS